MNLKAAISSQIASFIAQNRVFSPRKWGSPMFHVAENPVTEIARKARAAEQGRRRRSAVAENEAWVALADLGGEALKIEP
jgi:hypothetical protein